MSECLRCVHLIGRIVLRTAFGHRRMIQVVNAVMVLALAISASADVVNVRQNLDKYWLYRNKQHTEYLVPGIGQGYSVPACWRNPETHVMKWADATIDLGWYIGSLATEHYMLSHPETFPGYASGGGDLTQIRNRLYWALSAMDRVDAVAEASFNPIAPDTPGFFIRDDVPADFYTHFPGMTITFSDFSDPVLYNKEMSQDQVVHVLLGLSLVKKLIPSDLVVNGMNLRQAAINRGTAIIDWVHHDGWIIKNPVSNTDVVRGEDARAYSTGFNKTVVYLTDGATDFSSSISGFYSWVWSTLSDPANPAYDNRNNLHMAMSLAATGNGWGDATLDDLMSLSVEHDWYAYVLLYAVLYDPVPQSRPTWSGHRSTFNGLVQTMLNNAPSADTPHHPLDSSELNTGWCGCRRFIITKESQNNGEGEYSVGQWYNGLDYSLLHNLYYIVTPSLWQDPSPPGQASAPSPSNGATGVSYSGPTLSWSAGNGAASHDVYFGTTNPPVFVQNQTGTTYNPGTLSGNTTYYWRINEKGITGTTIGNVWSFTTAVPPDVTPPGPVSYFSAGNNTMHINLFWINPNTADFAGTRIIFKTTGYPTSPNDGTLLYSGTDTSFIHTGISAGTTYYYAAYAYDEVPNYSTPSNRSVVRPGPYCYADSFSYPNGNLNGNVGWSGSAGSQIQVDNSTVKINGGSGSYDAVRLVSCGDPGSGFIWASIKAKAGMGTSTMWSLYIDDPAGNNLARWYGSGTTAKGRIGSTSDVTPTWSLTSNWDQLSVKISPSANTSEFFVNGVSIGTLSHASQGAGDTIGRLRFERIDNAGAAGNYVYLDDLIIGPPDTAAPASVTSFTVIPGNTLNNLSWINPGDGDYAGTMIRFKTTGYPASTADGALIYNGAGTSYTHTGLVNGTTYYYSAFAYDEVPNYSSKSNASTMPAYTDAAQAKLLANNTPFTLTTGIVSASFTDQFYVQCVNKPVGIRVDKTGHGLSVGQSIGVKGTALTDPASDEKYISAVWAQANSTGLIFPVAMGSPAVGGVAWNYTAATGAGQRGITDATGPNNLGLLVRVWGKVTQRDTANSNYFYIDDGSAIKDGTKTGPEDNTGVRVKADPAEYVRDSYVIVTGVVSCFKDTSGNLRRMILPRSGEIQLCW